MSKCIVIFSGDKQNAEKNLNVVACCVFFVDHPIIHRDIKSSNILLTEHLRAKVADFGFARQAADSDSGMTHVSTQVKGTAGYLDPEYLKTYQLTEKSDVYSFGVLLVEIVTGRRPIEPKFELRERITAKWVCSAHLHFILLFVLFSLFS